MKIRRFLTMAFAAAALLACNGERHTPDPEKPETETPGEIVKGDYAKGADISWVTQMESDGQKFYSADGRETECTALMKQIGFNAIRLRVWVNPDGGWCGKNDVLVKAKRAQALGMRLMIDFHYSDTWADPSKQVTPAAWSSFGVEELTQAVGSHTTDILKTMKDNNIEVEWVQIGNEINDGMLHPYGKLSEPEKIQNFVKFFNAGSAAARQVYPEVKIILHRSNGHDTTPFAWLLDTMKYQKLDYDIIGMSLYPTWWENGGWRAWKSTVDACIANISSFAEKYSKPVMLCEVGMPVSEPQMAKEAMQYILDETGKIEDCHGVFYWEPQTDGVWKPASYAALGWNAYNMGAFKGGRPTAALDPFAD